MTRVRSHPAIVHHRTLLLSIILEPSYYSLLFHIITTHYSLLHMYIVHYTGRLMDGTIFDSSISRNTTFKFTLGQGVIEGWSIGFATMKKGEKAVLQCGPKYAYGPSGSPPKIPPNATLRFTVELINFAPKRKEAWQMKSNEKVEEADKCKNEGNRAFTSGDLHGAIDEYKAGWKYIEYFNDDEANMYDPLSDTSKTLLQTLRVTLQSNMAMVYLKLENYREAMKAADTALKYDPNHAKSLFRRGTARSHIGMFEEAKSDLLQAVKLAPSDAAIRNELERVKQVIQAGKEREKKAFSGIFNKKNFSFDDNVPKDTSSTTASTTPAVETVTEPVSN